MTNTRYALITGASSGIGLQYATQLARDYRYNLLLVSNQEEQLVDLARLLQENYAVSAIPLYKDLTDTHAAQEIFDYCQQLQLEVEVLVNNAGFLIFTPFNNVPLGKVNAMLQLHVVTTTNLCHLFGKEMCRRGKGYILNMSSMSAWMAMPGIQLYNATKSYLLNFSKALWYEYKRCGVTVTAVCPGAIDTPLYDISDKARRILRNLHIIMPPEKLVRRALKAMFRGKKKTVPGFINHIAIPIINHLPDWFVLAAQKRLKVFNPD